MRRLNESEIDLVCGGHDVQDITDGESDWGRRLNDIQDFMHNTGHNLADIGSAAIDATGKANEALKRAVREARRKAEEESRERS